MLVSGCTFLTGYHKDDEAAISKNVQPFTIIRRCNSMRYDDIGADLMVVGRFFGRLNAYPRGTGHPRLNIGGNLKVSFHEKIKSILQYYSSP